jgi:hypothetical protein
MVLNPSPIYNEDYKGFGPRVGFAWKVLPKTVVRGGSGFTNLPRKPPIRDSTSFSGTSVRILRSLRHPGRSACRRFTI